MVIVTYQIFLNVVFGCSWGIWEGIWKWKGKNCVKLGDMLAYFVHISPTFSLSLFKSLPQFPNQTQRKCLNINKQSYSEKMKIFRIMLDFSAYHMLYDLFLYLFIYYFFFWRVYFEQLHYRFYLTVRGTLGGFEPR